MTTARRKTPKGGTKTTSPLKLPEDKFVQQGIEALQTRAKLDFERLQKNYQLRNSSQRAYVTKLRERLGITESDIKEMADNYKSNRELLKSERNNNNYLKSYAFNRRPPSVHISSKDLSSAFRTRPYDYQWTYSSGTPNLPSNSLSVNADKASGDMSFDIWTVYDDANAGVAYAALGIYIPPPRIASSLAFFSSTIVDGFWGTYCVLAEAISQGDVYIAFQSYKVSDNSLDNTTFVNTKQLFYDDSFFVGTSGQSFDPYDVSSHANFLVDPDHWYIGWTELSGYAAGDGAHTFWGSSAVANANSNPVAYMGWWLRA
jgi:hypothetical protein